MILVNELEQAIADYTALGFTVVRGGEHPSGTTHNALVAFTDGAYLELIAFKQPAERQRWWQLGQRAGEGLVDYALLPGDIAQDVRDTRVRGLELEGPASECRALPNAAGRAVRQRSSGRGRAWIADGGNLSPRQPYHADRSRSHECGGQCGTGAFGGARRRAVPSGVQRRARAAHRAARSSVRPWCAA
ncbi:MAG TPA: VOC family protein [Roseiflexaceae bacterium]|nr:VOC family protein [Roseiflexaceae bacterium]